MPLSGVVCRFGFFIRSEWLKMARFVFGPSKVLPGDFDSQLSLTS
jgi:hypothetical protein